MSEIKDIPELRLDRSAVKIGQTIEDSAADERSYWSRATVKERLQHIERLRRLNYGTRATERLQKTVRSIEVE